MKPLIESEQLVTVQPAIEASLVEGDIVLCRVKGSVYLHLIKQVLTGTDKNTSQPYTKFLIGNNRGSINGWTTPDRIYGKCIKVEA